MRALQITLAFTMAFTLVACTGGSPSAASKSGPVADRQWSSFESTAGRFRVALPEEPTRHEQGVQAEGLATKSVQFTSVVDDGSEFNVSYADYPDAITDVDPRLVLNGAVAGSVKQASGTLARQTPLTAEGSPAVDYVINSDRGMLQARAILVGNRLYLLQLAGGRPDPRAFERLVTSFELL